MEKCFSKNKVNAERKKKHWQYVLAKVCSVFLPDIQQALHLALVGLSETNKGNSVEDDTQLVPRRNPVISCLAVFQNQYYNWQGYLEVWDLELQKVQKIILCRQ